MWCERERESGVVYCACARNQPLLFAAGCEGQTILETRAAKAREGPCRGRIGVAGEGARHTDKIKRATLLSGAMNSICGARERASERRVIYAAMLSGSWAAVSLLPPRQVLRD